MKLTLATPIIEFPRHNIAKLSVGMTQKLAAALAGVSEKTDAADVTVEDLLNYFPARYEDRSNFISIDKLEPGMHAAVELYVRTASGIQVGKNRDRWKPPLYLFELTGGDAERRLQPVSIKWFISGKGGSDIVKWYADKFPRGTRLVVYGLWDQDNRGQIFMKIAKPDEIEILPPVAGSEDFGLLKEPTASNDSDEEENISDPSLSTIHTGKVPIYRKLGPFQTKRLREIVHSVISNLDPKSVEDVLPKEMRERHDLVSRAQALKEVHFPPETASISEYEMFRSPAHRRLIFEEFFWLSFAMQLLRGERQKESKGTVIEITDTTKQRLKDVLPFALTNAQKKVIGEIFADLKSDAPMNRLIQGDVGSGKTIVAFLAMLAAMENGYQTALMAPTEILAEQHFRNATRILQTSGYRIELLIGSTKAAAKRKIYDALKNGEIDLVIGTHAIIQEGVEFDKLGLAVIDEQHRFGVMQRAQLKQLGVNPDVLVMTATPIPRSLAMTVYGDLDVSVIDEMPPGRTPIKTVVLGEDERRGVYRGIEREVKLGHQAYVVYPLIDVSAKTVLKDALDMYDLISRDVFPEYKFGLLLGGMKPG
jgi:ATP-dependent DNA helicase RecG